MGELRRSIVFKGNWYNDEPTGEFDIIIDGVKTKTINAEEVEDYGSPD